MRILVVGASPDALNNNVHIRGYVAKGFEAIVGEQKVQEASLEKASITIASWDPTLVVIFGSCMPDQSAYLSIRKICSEKSIPIAFWLHDDPYEFDYAFKAQEIADWIFSNDRWSSMHYQHEKAFHLPLAGHPAVHYRPWQSHKNHQIFFCGVAFPNRIQLLTDLSKILEKYSTHICGKGWPLEASYCQNVAIENEQLPDVIASSLVTLNIGRHFNLANDRFLLDASTPGPRTFEAAMAGTVQFYFADSLEIEDYFVPNQEILLFDDPKTFDRQLERVVDDPTFAKNLAIAAQERALRDHTYEMRCRQLLHTCELISTPL
jgi:spore maturation protein CgeB